MFRIRACLRETWSRLDSMLVFVNWVTFRVRACLRETGSLLYSVPVFIKTWESNVPFYSSVLDSVYFFVNLGDYLLNPVPLLVKLGDSVLHSVSQC